MLLQQCLRVVILSFGLSLLSSCYLVPGIFDATLVILRDGNFTYRYSGEIVFADIEHPPENDWNDKNAKCFDYVEATQRSCTPTEIKEQRVSYEADQAMSRERAAEASELTGFDAYDSAANQKFASELMHYDGWKNVVYKGRGVFAVEYEISGMLDRSYVFPTIPNAQVIVPFLSINPSKYGVVNIAAPGLVAGSAKNIVMRQLPKSDEKDLHFWSRINGNFKLTTDAELSFYNGKPVRNLENKREAIVNWQINAGEASLSSGKAPEAQVILP